MKKLSILFLSVFVISCTTKKDCAEVEIQITPNTQLPLLRLTNPTGDYSKYYLSIHMNLDQRLTLVSIDSSVVSSKTRLYKYKYIVQHSPYAVYDDIIPFKKNTGEERVRVVTFIQYPTYGDTIASTVVHHEDATQTNDPIKQ